MSKLYISSDLHLGHANICKFRPGFSSPEEHHETMFDNLATTVGKRDSVILLGDVAFDLYWLNRLLEINCQKLTLIVGNHDTEKLNMRDLASVYNEIHSMLARRNVWFTHCPIHPDEFRGKVANIHGHLHDKVIDDPRYINACVEHHSYKPVTFAELMERVL